MGIEGIAAVVVVWVASGLAAYFWIKRNQEWYLWYNDGDGDWYPAYRQPTPEMVRRRFWSSFLGPIALFLLALITINDC